MIRNPLFTVYDSSVEQFINTDVEIKKLDSTCSFSEGPVWSKEGFYLFSDIPENVVCKIVPGQDKEVFITNSGFSGGDKEHLSEQTGSNGLSFDKDGALLLCQHGNGAVARWDGVRTALFIPGYGGKPFNSPNDIVAHPNGSVFFSDPPYGLKDGKLQPQMRQPVAGFYCWRDGQLSLLSDRYQFPNGVCLSPDGNSLYTCSNKPYENFVSGFDVATLRFTRIVAAENGDGIKCDRAGNIYLCTKEGILIINEVGKRLAKIELETIPANACWGGPHLSDLFITARQHIFLIPSLQKS